jgi:uncharacterized protein
MSSQAFRARKVINFHAHLKPGEDFEQKIATWKAQGAVRTCVQFIVARPSQPGFQSVQNDEAARLLGRYPDHLIGFGGVNLSEDPDRPEVVARLRAQGFRGLKFIMPARPYDDDLYLPIYEAAAREKMVVFFHTGTLSYPAGYRGSCLVDYMRPIRLERIGRLFPELSVVGAHLGTPWTEEAVNLALGTPNIYFDICGGSGKPQRGTYIKRALMPFPEADLTDPDQHLALRLFGEKLVFATDNPTVETWVGRSLDILDYLRIPETVRECFFWRTAARILGLGNNM